MKRIVILISGRGSNLQAIARACERERWGARIAAVVCNRPQAEGLSWAREHGLHTEVVDHQAFDSRAAFDAALQRACDVHEPDLLALAGFMRVLGDEFVRHYAGRMVNVHPSLLPAFPGLHTHRQALAAGVKWAGATAHYVTPTLAHGPIIAQTVVPVRPDDTEQTLSARVLQAEHAMYPQAVRWAVEGRLALQGERVVQLDGLPQHWLHRDD